MRKLRRINRIRLSLCWIVEPVGAVSLREEKDNLALVEIRLSAVSAVVTFALIILYYMIF